jgi:hypothetical protein
MARSKLSAGIEKPQGNQGQPTAHANLVYTGSNFEVSLPFFDFEDDYAVKSDLWRIGNIAISLLDLFYGVNQSVGSIKFVEDFSQRFGILVERSNALRAEMM